MSSLCLEYTSLGYFTDSIRHSHISTPAQKRFEILTEQEGLHSNKDKVVRFIKGIDYLTHTLSVVRMHYFLLDEFTIARSEREKSVVITHCTELGRYHCELLSSEDDRDGAARNDVASVEEEIYQHGIV